MPELPEVETVIRQIKDHVLHKAITDLTVTKDGERLIAPLSPSMLASRLGNLQITDIERHGKFMNFMLNDTSKVVAHLRMSGRFTISKNTPFESKHNRLHLTFDDNTVLNFIDIRRFATFHHVESGESYSGLTRLGKDALKIDPEELFNKLQARTKPIYSSLLDQSVLAGLGNIYVNEVLYASNINPLRPSNEVTEKEAVLLVNEMQRILTMAINYRGTTLIDKSYKDVDGLYGDFFSLLKVYGKQEDDVVDGKKIKKIRIGGRSVYYTDSQS